MNLKQLRQFLVVAETLSFRSAAEKLHMAQPPLSVSIRLLENEIGERLFDRSPGGVRLTAVGRSVLEHARRTLFHAEQFRHAAQLAAGGQVGSLRINFVASSTIKLLPRAIAHFRAGHPNVELRLQEASTNNTLIALRDGLVDVGVVRYPTPPNPAIALTVLEENYYVAALPAAHPKASKARLRLADLRDEPFIFPSRMEGSAAYMSTMLACQKAGFMPNIVQEAYHAQAIVALVESGLGVSLVPNVWKDLATRAVKFKELTGMTEDKIGLAFACRKDEEESVLLKNFRSSLLSVAKNMTLPPKNVLHS